LEISGGSTLISLTILGTLAGKVIFLCLIVLDVLHDCCISGLDCTLDSLLFLSVVEYSFDFHRSHNKI
jgi:hypothetical protein